MARKHRHKGGAKTSVSANPNRQRNSAGPRRGRPANPAAGSRELWLFGTHAVEAALRNPKRNVKRLLATPEAAQRLEAKGIGQPALSLLEPADRSAIELIVGEEAVHQGVAAHVATLPDLEIEDALGSLGDRETVLLVALDHVTDPHNVGAIMRSAAAFGAAALIVTKHNAPDETGVLAKSASGALEHVALVRATNLSRAIETCQQNGFWVVGLDAHGESDIDDLDLPDRCVLVLGAEGEGVRPGVQKVCDFMARLPMAGTMESLNVSNAGAIALFEWHRQKRAKKG